jgi:hypothetical protein
MPSRTVKLPNADDPALRQLNNLRTLRNALLSQEPLDLPPHSAWLGDSVMSGPPGGVTFEEMMAVVNRRSGVLMESHPDAQ